MIPPKAWDSSPASRQVPTTATSSISMPTPGSTSTASLRAGPDDSFGLAFAYSHISDSVSAAEQDAIYFSGVQRPIQDYEAALELTYQAQIVPGWTIQPDFQYIFHPGGHIGQSIRSDRRGHPQCRSRRRAHDDQLLTAPSARAHRARELASSVRAGDDRAIGEDARRPRSARLCSFSHRFRGGALQTTSSTRHDGAAE